MSRVAKDGRIRERSTITMLPEVWEWVEGLRVAKGYHSTSETIENVIKAVKQSMEGDVNEVEEQHKENT